MEGVVTGRSSLTSPMLAVVARQFSGSRVERQVVSQVFDVVWQVASGGMRAAVLSVGRGPVPVSLGLETRAGSLGFTEGGAS